MLRQLAVLFFCGILLVAADAAEPETKPADAKAEAAVTTTKLTPSEEPKSKTEKRDSSDQTGECKAVEDWSGPIEAAHLPINIYII